MTEDHSATWNTVEHYYIYNVPGGPFYTILIILAFIAGLVARNLL